MYDFHYNYIKNKYGSKAKLLFTDTDSLCYKIETKDIHKELERTNNYLTIVITHNSPYFSAENKKVIGKFKDEAAGMPIKEFIGLRSKIYSYVKDDGKMNRQLRG